MHTQPHIPPLQRQALLAALRTPNRSLRRSRGGYVALDADIRTSGKATAYAFTGRIMNMMWRAGLVDFDEPNFPSVVTLTKRGAEVAEQLLASERAKATAR